VQLSRSKTTVLSYLLLALFGMAASWISWFNQSFRLEYAVPVIFSTLMLFWIRNNPIYYAKPFYRNAWHLNTLLLCLTAFAGIMQLFPLLFGGF